MSGHASQPGPVDPVLVADIDEIFLGWWDTPLLALCFADYRPHAIQTYARQHGSAAREREPEPGDGLT
ncbi:hypothetical protein ACH4GK_31955 [Streptomyces rimosus]|uniref:hypothetical protein n=1 Tax=Streptomyces rimosus TaxID=1927 RepID=UPI0004CADCB4|nr:hypothetical protein [Streptomyces rimosus]